MPFSTSMSTDISVTVFPSTFKVTVFEVLPMYLVSPSYVALMVYVPSAKSLKVKLPLPFTRPTT